MAQKTPNGTAIKRERPVIPSEPIIMGNIPNLPFEGAHSIPNRKLKNPTLCNAGIPSLNMKMIIRAMIIMDDIAVSKSPFSMKYSSFHLDMV
jgi:hypothetical protein